MSASRKSKTTQVTAVPPTPAPRPMSTGRQATAAESLRALQLSMDTRQ